MLLIQRDRDPFAGAWAIPGGFVEVGESLEAAARRELAEETGLNRIYLEQLYTFGDPGRDPREHVVTVAYYALVNIFDHHVQAATDARDAAWFAVSDLPSWRLTTTKFSRWPKIDSSEDASRRSKIRLRMVRSARPDAPYSSTCIHSGHAADFALCVDQTRA